MAAAPSETEAELERFREEWRREVARGNNVSDVHSSIDGGTKFHKRQDVAPTIVASSSRQREIKDYSEDVEPKAYHDLIDPEEKLKLGREDQDQDRDGPSQPSSALEHYETAVEKESHGQLGDSLNHYRKAFKLDDSVHEQYKKKHFPVAKSKPTNPNPSNAAATVPGTGHHSLYGSTSSTTSLTSLKEMMKSFSSLRIEAAPPPTDASPREPSPLAQLPEEILTHILTYAALADVASLNRVAQVCKRLAYLVLTEESIWKTVAMQSPNGFNAMRYDFACDVAGFRNEANDEIAKFLDFDRDEQEPAAFPASPEEQAAAFSNLTEKLLHSTYASSWRQMFRSRARIRFNGCYISTVNYPRSGAMSTNTLTWGVPVHIVTYYRYLRFFRDGTVISLLTTSEPTDVVHYLLREHLHGQHNNTLPSSVMKDALRGRWRLSGPASRQASNPEQSEAEGHVHIETEGVVPKYTYKLLLVLTNAGKGARNNKLAWKWFGSYNRLTDDWAEFGLKNDRAFYWSRVGSYRD